MASKNDIKVQRDGDTRYFDKATWTALPPNKYGWKPVVEMPEEVKALIDKGQSAAVVTQPVTPSSPGEVPNQATMQTTVITEPPKRDLVVNVVKKIESAKTIDEVNALCPDDEDRVTIITAANFKIEQLQKQTNGPDQPSA